MSRKSWTKRQRAIFLDVLRRTGNVSAAARAADVPRRSIYAYKAKDPEFAEEWASAMDEALDDLEHAMRQRALTGVEKHVYYGGKPCGTVRSYADNVGIFLLKAHRPRFYAEKEAVATEADDPAATARARLRGALDRMGARLDDGQGEDAS